MKKLFLFSFLILAISFMANAKTQIILIVGGNSMTATLVDNEATRELKDLLSKGCITIHMSDYGGFEKVGELPKSFTTSNSQITTEPGDIMLYQGNNLVIFYGSNSWSYTRLGKIDGATAANIREFLGSGDISLTLSLEQSSDVQDIRNDRKSNYSVYDVNGVKILNNAESIEALSPGLYIINGVKTLVNRK